MLKWKVDSPAPLLSFIKKKFKEYSVKDLRWAIEHNRCSVNGVVERFCSFRLKEKDDVVLWPTKRPFLKFEDSRVLFEDDHLIAYDKPSFFDSESLAECLNAHLVHRLDRDTSGVILFAKTTRAKLQLEDLFRNRLMEKEYLALVEGCVEKNQLTIELNMAKWHPRHGTAHSKVVKNGEGLWSKTEVECLKKNKDASLLLCKPITGRTHQIRVHLKSVGYPILGDYEYGSKLMKQNLFRPLLHAKEIKFSHPETSKEIKIETPLSEDFVFWRESLGL